VKILFATDFHGSEVCWRKLFNLGPRAKADVIVCGGDLCGKALVPIVERNGHYSGEFLGQQFEASTEAEAVEIEQRIRFNGFYPRRTDPDELESMRVNEEHRNRIMEEEMVRSVEHWLEIAEEKLAGTDTICVTIPGNDDSFAIDAALNGSTRVLNCDGRLIDFGSVQIVGFGASNRTPWDSPREFPEEEIASRLAQAAAGVDRDRPYIANIHVPPYNSMLDEAPKIDSELRPVYKGGSLQIEPVGSHAVRTFLESSQPWTSLHGHIHESRRSNKIGETLAVNPGSDYASGTLQAAVITLDLKRRRAKGNQFVSG
jgi:uncharacterized protein